MSTAFTVILYLLISLLWKNIAVTFIQQGLRTMSTAFTVILYLLISLLWKNIGVTLDSAEAKNNEYCFHCNTLFTYQFTIEKHRCYLGFSRGYKQ